MGGGGEQTGLSQLLLTGLSLKMKMKCSKSTAILDLALISVKASFASALLLPPFILSCLPFAMLFQVVKAETRKCGALLHMHIMQHRA